MGEQALTIYSFISLFGGLALFLYGMHVLSGGLEKTAGGKIQSTLRKLTDNPFKGLAFGCIITIAIQSSSALTVMLVGLVNSGIIQLSQTIGIIMGSNIGTTLTAWLLSLAGIESSNIVMNLIKPVNSAPIVAVVGIAMLMISKNQRKKDIGTVLIGFSLLMQGMTIMSSAMSPLADMPEFESLLTAFSNPLLGVLVGAVVTGVIQSSAASVGILQALSLTGNITFGMAIPIIMGQNIGTCVTALISSIGVNRNAKRVAAIHIYFNVIGTAICLSAFLLFNSLFDFAFVSKEITPFGIAVTHSIFNFVTTAILLPFTKLLEKLARLTIKDKGSKEAYSFIDDRLLLSPSLAISESRRLTVKMANLSRDTFFDAIKLMDSYSEKLSDKLIKNEGVVDTYEDNLGTFLVKISSKELSEADSNTVSTLLHTIGDFERISDHAVNLQKTAKEMHDKNIHFSEQAKGELLTLTDAITEILSLTVNAFDFNNPALAMQVEPLEQVIDKVISDIKNNHIKRLQGGNCTIELGFVLNDLLTNYERVSDHCSNIAVCLIQINQSTFGTHEYLNEYKNSGSEEFTKAFEMYKAKYKV